MESLSPSKPSLDDLFFQKLNAFLGTRFTDAEMIIPEISQAMLMSHTQLYRKLKALMGRTPSQ